MIIIMIIIIPSSSTSLRWCLLRFFGGHDCWLWPIYYLIRFWSIFVATLTLNFQGQTWNLLYLSPKWSDCHETKSKHITWTLGLKCDHWVWPWPWPWPWIFKVKYRFCYISAKNGPTATKRKANISIELNASNVTIRFDLGHDLDLEFSRSNKEFAISQPKVVQLPRNEKQTYRLNSRPQMWPMALTLTTTMTFGFSRSNVTLTFDHTHGLDHGFSWSNFEIDVSQNGRADWHFTKGLAVGHSWSWSHVTTWPFGDQGQVCASTR